MTDNPETKDGANPSLPPKLDLRKKIALGDDSAKAQPVIPKLTPTSAPGAPISLKPRVATPGASTSPSPAPRMSTVASSDSQTVHIQIPKAQTQVPSAMTPKPPPTASETVAPAVRPSAPSAALPGAPSGALAPDKKRETSKIPLVAASPEAPTVRSTPSSDGPVKTIRIRPKSATAQTQKVAEPGVLAEATDPFAEKKKTSRISLEAALSSDQETSEDASAAPRPKTIRLKRPSEAATVKVTPKSAMPGTATDRQPSVPAAKLEETSRLEMPPVQPAQASPTQRKTIRVKRPTQQPGVAPSPSRIATTARGPMGKPAAGVPMADAPVRSDEPHAIFPVFAILTLLVMMVGIYMFSAQAFGPNSSFTQLSYAVEGPDLGWPGKLPPPRQ